MEKWFCKTFSLLCLDWKPLSPWPSRQPSHCLEIVPSSFLHRGKAGAVCYGRCQRSQQLTGRKVLFLKKKKKCPKPPLISGARRLNLIPSPVLILGGLGQVTLLTLFCSTWKRRMKCSRGILLPGRRNAAHQEPLEKPQMDKTGSVALFHSPAVVSKSVYLVIFAWSFERHPKEMAWVAAPQTNCCLGAGCRQRAVVCTSQELSVDTKFQGHADKAEGALVCAQAQRHKK